MSRALSSRLSANAKLKCVKRRRINAALRQMRRLPRLRVIDRSLRLGVQRTERRSSFGL
jgi:hypothetical protein